MNVSDDQGRQYAGFWIRVWAALIDSLLITAIVVPLLLLAYGQEIFESPKLFYGPLDVLISWVLPVTLTLAFWVYKSATPGKMAISTRIVDVKTGLRPSFGQFLGRYLGYIVSSLPLGLGLLWVAFDEKKQGWHDKLAGTVVVYKTSLIDSRPT